MAEEKGGLLAAKEIVGIPGLWIVLENGRHTKTLSAYMEGVLASELSLKDKTSLLAAVNSKGIPGLYIALNNGHTEIVSVYMEGVLSSELPAKDKKELLLAVTSKGIPGFLSALNHGHTETVSVYMKGVLASKLTAEEKIGLLQTKNVDLPPGKSWGLYKKDEHQIESILDSTTLDADAKISSLKTIFLPRSEEVLISTLLDPPKTTLMDPLKLTI